MMEIKIISNPYQGTISYQRRKDSAKEWEEVDYTSNPNCMLLSAELTGNFFSFVAKKIVDEIIREYTDNKNKINIVFEGNMDEYSELENICNSEEYSSKVSLSKSDRALENASNILPDIRDIFKKVEKLIDQSQGVKEKVSEEIDKFTEASNDIIPICIVGNYSSGKSTFINALIGAEILPSGDEPLTAKVFRIERAMDDKKAILSFVYEGDEIEITFTEKKTTFKKGKSDKELIVNIQKALDELDDSDMVKRINHVLAVVNSFEKEDDAQLVSDVIELSVPFSGGLWSQSPKKFIIFDTPGSNSASNEKHFKMLEKAMENLTNGLPVFVTEYNALDTKDNEALCLKIKTMKELDSRFAMIVVNKADAAGIKYNVDQKQFEDEVLHFALPKKLYSEGIYFVSSIMGLGSQNNGDFSDDHYAQVFESQERNYSDPTARFYRSLYKFNIMSDQLKKKSVDSAERCENKMFANSGLYSVEEEVLNFADKYSAYNKCLQSEMFIKKIIKVTTEEIEKTKENKDILRQQMIDEMESRRKEILTRIEDCGTELEGKTFSEYPINVRPIANNTKTTFAYEDMKKLEGEYLQKHQEEKNLYSEQMDVVKAKEKTKANFKENLAAAFRKPKLSSFGKILTGLQEDMAQTLREKSEVKAVKKSIDQGTTEDFLVDVINVFNDNMDNAYDKICDVSEKYWKEKVEYVKENFMNVVTESTELDEKEKEDLSEIIFSFHDIEFEKDAREIFNKEELEGAIKVWKFSIGNKDRLNIDKLCQKYNQEMDSGVEKVYEMVRDSHMTSMRQWTQELLSLVRDNIIEYNPELKDQNEKIKVEEKKILDLDAKLNKLSLYTADIGKMMAWKEA